MANRTVQMNPHWPGALAAGLVASLTLGTLAAVATRAGWALALGPADWSAIRFTVAQAACSALVSCVLAIPVARALARRRFWGRSAIITLLGAPFLLPVIVAVLGLLAVFGRGGIVNAALAALGLPEISIYGFHGVVLAHVFFNLPLVTRLLLQGWLSIPSERFRLAASLNASTGRLLELPMLRAVLPGAFLVVFLICLTSFAVALTLGGGPKATTVELAIYQALRFEFDLGRAALLAVVQFGLCITAATLAWRVQLTDGVGAGLDRAIIRTDGFRLIDTVAIIMAVVFLATPLLMIVWRGIGGLPSMPPDIWWAAVRSICVAAASAVLCMTTALALALRGGLIVSVVGVLPLAASSLVLGTGLFILIYPFASPTDWALPMTAIVNAVLALPFALRSIGPAVEQVTHSYGRLGASLGMSTPTWLLRVVLPRVRQPLGFASGIAAALSMGDLGVITLFADSAQETLPLAMYRLMGAYQTDAAAGVAVVLLALTLAIFWLCDKGGRGHAGM